MRRWHVGAGGALATALLLVVLFPPFSLTMLAPVALTPLLYTLAAEPRWQWRLGWGWLAGFIYWTWVCYWIQGVLNRHGGLGLGLSVLALVLFGLAKGLHLAVFAAIAGPLLGRSWGLLAAPALWAGLERTHGELGFAWLNLGNAGIEMALPLRAAPWAGVYGVSFVFAALAAGAAHAALRKPRRELLWLAPLVLLAVLPGIEWTTPPAQTAAVLQPNIPDGEPWTRAGLEQRLERMALKTLEAALSASAAQPELLLWPEVPGPFYYYGDASFRDLVTKVARLAATPFLFGAVAFTTRGEPLNAAVMLDAGGRLRGRYDKMRLVPFGEFVPPLFGWVNKVSDEAGDFQPGARRVVFEAGAGAVGAFICYESAFPEHVRAFANDGATVLVNLTNDGYFARSAARAQHLLLARMRAVENRRWVLRPANDGTTVSIAPDGRLAGAFRPFSETAGRLRYGHSRAKTPYTRHGDWFAWGSLAVGLAARVLAEVPGGFRRQA